MDEDGCQIWTLDRDRTLTDFSCRCNHRFETGRLGKRCQVKSLSVESIALQEIGRRSAEQLEGVHRDDGLEVEADSLIHVGDTHNTVRARNDEEARVRTANGVAERNEGDTLDEAADDEEGFPEEDVFEATQLELDEAA